MFQRFFPHTDSLFSFLSCLHRTACPRCRHNGALKRHGYIRGFVSSSEHGIRAWRIYCNPKRGGCGHAPSVRLDTSLVRRCISTAVLWAFLSVWAQGGTVREAWEAAGGPLSPRCAWRILHRLRAGLTALRIHLCARGPPPAEIGARNPSVQTLLHLRAVFGAEDPIRAAQRGVQKPFPV